MNIDTRPLAVFLMGPTASGKTALACDLQDRFAFEIVSVDSALVYKGMDIGTAKPSALEQAQHPHHLVDIRDISEPYSAADFRHDALCVMQNISSRGNIPLLVGGTGLYFRALEKGLSPLPHANPEVRAQIIKQARCLGWPALHQRLTQLDHALATRIKPNDAQRIQRALEVLSVSGGKTVSELWAEGNKQVLPYRVCKLALLPGQRRVLHERINARFASMLDASFMDEVKALMQYTDKYVDNSAQLPAWRAVGYRQARQFLLGEMDYDTFVAKACAATRQLAKRQITWLRRELDAIWIDSMNMDSRRTMVSHVDNFLQKYT